MSVVWKFYNYKCNAEDAYKEMQTLKVITTQNVVNLARNEDSVMHNDFEWDDEIAGEKYRVIQAQTMIRNLVLVDNSKDEPAEELATDKPKQIPIRVLHNTTNRNEYKPTEYFIENKDEYQTLLSKALAELEAFKKRYAMIAELEEVFNAINNL